MTKKIALGHGKFALVDDIDHWFLIQWEWHCSYGYAVRNGYINNKRKIIFMHRVILERKLGHNNFKETDHTNQNKLDNHRDNLQSVTTAQNQWNSSKRRNNTSGYIGVTLDKSREKWLAQIQVNKKRIHLGRFDDKKEAARAYDRAAIKHHGKYACLNFDRSNYD